MENKKEILMNRILLFLNSKPEEFMRAAEMSYQIEGASAALIRSVLYDLFLIGLVYRLEYHDVSNIEKTSLSGAKLNVKSSCIAAYKLTPHGKSYVDELNLVK